MFLSILESALNLRISYKNLYSTVVNTGSCMPFSGWRVQRQHFADNGSVNFGPTGSIQVI